MIQWLNKRARCACLFAVLLVTLTGCNDSNDQNDVPSLKAASTFETVQSAQEPARNGSATPQEPVIGVVKPVPGIESLPPVITGGEAIPLITTPALNSQIVLPALAPEKVHRFMEIAPDTIGGATFESSPAQSYDLGNLVAMASYDSSAFTRSIPFITPIKGWVRYPKQALSSSSWRARYPVIVFLHGNHNPEDPSYQGYDYLAEDLATHGYVVLSIDANATNGDNGPANGDRSSQSRGQLVLGTLDRLRQINEQGQISRDGTPGALNVLKGKLDFDRIGIMGHSRGGQGIANAILFNKNRRGVTEEELKAFLITGRTNAFQKLKELYAKSKDPTLDRFIFLASQPSGLSDIMTDYKMSKEDAKEIIDIVVSAFASSTFSGYPDLFGALTRDDKSSSISIDNALFSAAITKYNIFYAAGNGNNASPYVFKGAFMLAPTDFAGIEGLNHVPLANLLPSCDGDVWNLQGARAYDHNRFGPADDATPRYQILIRGANHNFYNTIWTKRDDVIDYCKSNRIVYLNAKDQRRSGLFIMNSFMRYHVGGEQKFAAYWNSLAQLPKAACPAGKISCDERVVLTVQKDASRSRLIQRFDKAESVERNALGGKIAFSGFDQYERYDMASGDGSNVSEPLDGFSEIQSLTDHVELGWSDPDAAIVTDLAGISAKEYDSLTFRIAVVEPVGQEVMVTLTDNTGHSATVPASDFSDALYNAPRPKGDGRPMVDHPDDVPYVGDPFLKLLNMVAIPLKAFEGVDTTHLKELKLVFPKASGKVAITDIELQNLGRENPAATVAARQ